MVAKTLERPTKGNCGISGHKRERFILFTACFCAQYLLCLISVFRCLISVFRSELPNGLSGGAHAFPYVTLKRR